MVFLEPYQDIVLLLARLTFGVLFMIHGKPKFLGPKPGMLGFSNWLRTEGYPLPFLSGILVAFIEFLGGLAIILGFYTDVAAILFVPVMLVAIFHNRKKKKPFKGGWELDLMLIAMALVLAAFGAGAYSLDALLG